MPENIVPQRIQVKNLLCQNYCIRKKSVVQTNHSFIHYHDRQAAGAGDLKDGGQASARSPTVTREQRGRGLA